MSDQQEESNSAFVEGLAEQGYWPAQAARHLEAGRYSKVVEICKEHFSDEYQPLSGRLIYARALALAGQSETATEQFYHVLSHDPHNLVALKNLGDLRFAAGDELAAMAFYQRAMEIDPLCGGLVSLLKMKQKETTRTITLRRSDETAAGISPREMPRIPFFTETIGDIYLAQGHPRLAAEVFRMLGESGGPRIQEKLQRAEKKARERET